VPDILVESWTQYLEVRCSALHLDASPFRWFHVRTKTMVLKSYTIHGDYFRQQRSLHQNNITNFLHIAKSITQRKWYEVEPISAIYDWFFHWFYFQNRHSREYSRSQRYRIWAVGFAVHTLNPEEVPQGAEWLGFWLNLQHYNVVAMRKTYGQMQIEPRASICIANNLLNDLYRLIVARIWRWV
jgi:hypothetical protein